MALKIGRLAKVGQLPFGNGWMNETESVMQVVDIYESENNRREAEAGRK